MVLAKLSIRMKKKKRVRDVEFKSAFEIGFNWNTEYAFWRHHETWVLGFEFKGCINFVPLWRQGYLIAETLFRGCAH